MDILDQLLCQSDWFKGLSVSNRKALADICMKKFIQKKEILFSEGSSGEALFVLAGGTVQLHKTTPDGKEVVIRTVQRGEIFAEVVLFEENNYPVTAAALESSTLYAIPKTKFYTLLDRPDFRNDFIRILLKKQRNLADRIVQLTLHDVEARLFYFLKDHFGPARKITTQMTKKDVAAAIGTTPETFSRLLVKLREEGKLAWNNREIVVNVK